METEINKSLSDKGKWAALKVAKQLENLGDEQLPILLFLIGFATRHAASHEIESNMLVDAKHVSIKLSVEHSSAVRH